METSPTSTSLRPILPISTSNNEQTAKDVDLESNSSKKGSLWQDRLYHFMSNHSKATLSSRMYRYYLDGLVFLSILTLCLATVPTLADDPFEEKLWFALESFIAVNFIGDMLLKIISSRPATKYLKTWNFVGDALSVVPWIVETVIWMVTIKSQDENERLQFGQKWSVLRLLRMLRFARFYNATFTAFPDMHLFVQAVRQSHLAVVFLFVFISFSGIFFSSLLYYAETSICHYERERALWIVGKSRVPLDKSPPLCTFQNIFEAAWFVMVTITTVGYGDVQLKTTSAKIITVMMMICSVIGLSLPVAIFGANLTELYLERRLLKKSKKQLQGSSETSPSISPHFGNACSNSNNAILLSIADDLGAIRRRLDDLEGTRSNDLQN